MSPYLKAIYQQERDTARKLKAMNEAARKASESLNRMTEALVSTSEKEIKSKDRVDITLEEYLSMRKELEDLRSKVEFSEHLYRNMGIPIDVLYQIDPDSVQVSYSDSVLNILDHSRRVTVSFKVNII